MQSDFRAQVAHAGFRASPTTRDLCRKVQTIFGFRYYYEPLRMFMARSLVEQTPPPLPTLGDKKDLSLRGEQLFGAQELDAWVSVLLETNEAGEQPRISDLRNAAESHIARGAELFQLEADAADWQPTAVVGALAAHVPSGVGSSAHVAPAHSTPIRLQLGDVSEDALTGVATDCLANRADSQPHILVLGRDDRSRAGTALHMAEQLNLVHQIPVLIIDTEGNCRDLVRSGFAWPDAPSALRIVDVGTDAIPLDLFEASKHGKMFFAHQADQVIEAIQRALPALRTTRHGDALREIMNELADAGDAVGLSQVVQACSAREAKRGGTEATLQELHELATTHLFDGAMAPAEFLAESWLIDLSGLPREEHRHLVTLLLVDAVTAHLEGCPIEPDMGRFRRVKHATVIDSATRLLADAKHRGFDELLGSGWSRGEAILLTTPHPGDLQRQPRSRAEQFGGVIAFECYARRGMRLLGDIYGRKLLQDEFGREELAPGVALCRLPGQAPRKVRCWTVDEP